MTGTRGFADVIKLPPDTRAATAAATATVAAALISWIIVLKRMNGMDMGPGMTLGSFPSFIGNWVVMMAAMMLPSAVPMVASFARLSGDETRGRPPQACSLALTFSFGPCLAPLPTLSTVLSCSLICRLCPGIGKALYSLGRRSRVPVCTG